MTDSLDERYPAIAEWVKHEGMFEIGIDSFIGQFVVRAIVVGEVIWEGGDPDATLDDLFAAADRGIRQWLDIG